MSNWYVMHVQTGKEEIVKKRLVNEGEWDEKNILIPKVAKFEWKGGIQNCVLKEIFKGYVLIRLEMCPELYYKMVNNPFVYQVLGKGNKYHKVENSEIELLDALIDENGIIQMTKVKFSENGVTFLSGPLCKIENKIVKVNKRRLRAYIEVSLINNEKKIISVGLKAV